MEKDYGEFYKQIKRLHLSHPMICYVAFFIFKSYMMQRQRKQDKASPIKIQDESFGEKAGKIKQHLKNLLV